VRNDRAKQILSLLKIHGPLPSSALQLLLEPTIKPRKLRAAILRLVNRQLIELRKVKFTGEVLRYYQIDQSKKSLESAAKLLQCNESDLNISYFRYRDFLHNDGLSLLSMKLQKLFPDAEIIRDFALEKSEEALRILQYDETQDDLKPDLLLRLKNGNVNDDVWIAFELEKTRKDDRRLIRKLRKYAAKSHVDGVVYFCDKKIIQGAITTNYNNYVSSWARRISSYKNNFILLGDSDSIAQESIANLLRLDQKPVSLQSWISTLCVTQKNKRRDQDF
jgi:hypothetical protein